MHADAPKPPAALSRPAKPPKAAPSKPKSKPKPKTGPASNFILVQSRFRVDYVRLDADFEVHHPSYCPAYEPSSFDDPGFDSWWSTSCDEYRQQHAELYVQVMHAGRVVSEEDADGYDGKWSGRIYRWSLGSKCDPGLYRWTVVLRDPYGRRGMATSDHGYFTVTCR